MDLKFSKTPKGAVVSIHCGKITTTNLLEGGWFEITNPDAISMFKNVCRQLKWSKTEEDERSTVEKLIKDLNDKFPSLTDFARPYRRTRTVKFESSSSDEIEYDGVIDLSSEIKETPKEETTTTPIEKKRKDVCARIIKFFSEFTFVPATRFVNTLSKFENQKDAKTYISNYMNLTDHPDKNEINEKIKSDEFKNILTDLFGCRGDKEINKRLEIYYGPAGTGKTTEAIKLYPDANVTVCNELMDSDSIMKVFDFNDESGNPVFKPSQLQLDMIAGRPHILDEMNLLPLNTLRFLQGVLDSKEKINYEGKEIVIADGFKIIGTMNLVVNGQVFSLPEPIVDRAQKLKEYTANEDLLADFAF